MIYLPIETNANTCALFREFVVGLILKYADIEENSGDNFLQRILVSVKNDLFSLPEFMKLMDDLLFSTEGVSVACGEYTKLQGNSVVGIENTTIVGSKYLENNDDKQLPKSLPKPLPISIAILSQLLMAIMVFLCVKYFKLSGNNSTANYVAIGIIIVALDVIIFKNLFKGKCIIIKKENQDKENQVKENRDKQNRAIAEDSDFNVEATAAALKEQVKEQVKEPELVHFPTLSSNTVLLGNMNKGFPLLKSRNVNEAEDIVLDKTDFLIGRLGEQVDHVCKSYAVGKVHAQIISDGGVCLLKDLNSINGTFVNNIRIPSNMEHELKDGDRVAFANCEFVLVL
jgi:molybdopterin converting factor small subunit